jgi:3-oxoacyl-[acyl-carrier protein] reductase
MELDLAGKVAAVTGSAGSIGARTAVRLAEEGCDVAAIDFTPPGEALEQAITACGRRALRLGCDLTQPADVEAAVRRVLEAFGGIDILVNSAGVVSLGEIEELDVAEWDRVAGVNLKSAFVCSRAVIPLLKARRAGKIVNVASALGHTPVPAAGSYAAAAAGIIALGRTLALELGSHKVNVNTVAPGLTNGEAVPWHLAFSTWGLPGSDVRRAGLPDDVAKVVVFLASSAFDYVTGQTLFVNAGALMP